MGWISGLSREAARLQVIKKNISNNLQAQRSVIDSSIDRNTTIMHLRKTLCGLSLVAALNRSRCWRQVICWWSGLVLHFSLAPRLVFHQFSIDGSFCHVNLLEMAASLSSQMECLSTAVCISDPSLESYFCVILIPFRVPWGCILCMAPRMTLRLSMCYILHLVSGLNQSLVS